MPEVDLDYFKNPAKYHPKPPDADSVEAPQLPAALTKTTGILSVDPMEGELLGPDEQIPEHLQPVSRVPHALRGIDLTKLEGRADLISQLTQTLPENEYSLPAFIYQPDVLDTTFLYGEDAVERVWPEDIADRLHAATVTLNYTEGFPVFRNGKPFWAQLPYETKEAYGAFTQYIEQPGARTTHSMTAYPPEMVQEWHALNYWHYRARAYDLFKTAHHQRLREQRILGTTNRHYEESEKLFTQLSKTIGNIKEEDWEKVEPDKLVNMLEKAVKIQRLSLGLSTTGAADDSKAPQTTSVELAIRQVAQRSGGERRADTNDDQGLLLEDLEALTQAQELIVKVNNRS